MVNYKHYIKIYRHLLSQWRIKGKVRLMLAYTKLLVQSVLYYKFYSTRKRSAADFKANFLGYKIHFTSYPEIIYLVEEIFIAEVYKSALGNSAGLIVDCGSHVGLSVLYFKSRFPLCKVLAFEPDPDSFILLSENIRNNGLSNVMLFNAALSDMEGDMILYRHADLPGTLNMSLIISGEVMQEKIVQGIRLSDFIIEPVSMLKIDTEGAEVKIVNELIQSGKIDLVDQVVVEFHVDKFGNGAADFVDMMRSNGFSCQVTTEDLHPWSRDMMINCTRTKLQREVQEVRK